MDQTGHRWIALAVTCVVSGLWTPADVMGHVAPAVNANNRYLRISPMRDRVRLAYTVYIGEVPGAKARARMDENDDGAVSEAESRGYGDELAARVLKDLQVAVAGAPYALSWSEIHIGMGTPVTNAGSFSVDLIGWICTGDARAHRVSLIDRYRIPLPGETELKIQTNPGIDIERASIGENSEHTVQFKLEWRGNDGPLANKGLHLAYKIDGDKASRPPGDACSKIAVDSQPPRSRNWLALGLLASVGVVALAWFVRRRMTE